LVLGALVFVAIGLGLGLAVTTLFIVHMAVACILYGVVCAACVLFTTGGVGFGPFWRADTTSFRMKRIGFGWLLVWGLIRKPWFPRSLRNHGFEFRAHSFCSLRNGFWFPWCVQPLTKSAQCSVAQILFSTFFRWHHTLGAAVLGYTVPKYSKQDLPSRSDGISTKNWI
jgi:hypothetical protein